MIQFLRVFSPGNLRSLCRDRAGLANIEYSLLSAIIAVAMIAALAEIGTKVYRLFDSTAQLLEQTANFTSGKCGPGNGNGNCGNRGNGGGNTGGSGPGTGNGGGNNGQGNGAGNGGGGSGNGGPS